MGKPAKRLQDPDTAPFIAMVARKHAVDFDNLDENIQDMIRELAVDALDCRRMDGALRQSETVRPTRQQPPTVVGDYD